MFKNNNNNFLIYDLGKVEGEDVLQAEHVPFAQSKRGHQGPAAFLILASGLEKVSCFLTK